MTFEIGFTDEFEAWWKSLTTEEQDSIRVSVGILREAGPMLGRPHVDKVNSKQFPNMKELRVQHKGRPYRILFVFDPRRTAILLIGGDKTGKDRWYEEHIPFAEEIYSQVLKELEAENKKRKPKR